MQNFTLRRRRLEALRNNFGSGLELGQEGVEKLAAELRMADPGFFGGWGGWRFRSSLVELSSSMVKMDQSLAENNWMDTTRQRRLFQEDLERYKDFNQAWWSFLSLIRYLSIGNVQHVLINILRSSCQSCVPIS